MSSVFNNVLLLLPILSGYLLLITVPPFRYEVVRFSAYRLVLQSALTGILMIIAARIILDVIHHLPPTWRTSLTADALARSWRWLTALLIDAPIPDPRLEASVLAFLLSGGIALLASAVLKRSPRLARWAADRAALATGSTLERLIHRAMRQALLVQITLKSRKVYVGFVDANLDPTVPDRRLRIRPLMSGYRSEQTQEVRFTTDYLAIFEALREYSQRVQRGEVSADTEKVFHVKVPGDAVPVPMRFGDFGVIVRWDEIEIASIWDIHLHRYFRDSHRETTPSV